MGAAPNDSTFGIFRFLEPDLSVPAHERATFAGPASKAAKEETIELHDFRSDKSIARGREGLDVQGFTYVEHASSLTGEELLAGTKAEDIYAPEVIGFMLKLTGGSRAVAHDVGFRRKLANRQADLYHVQRRGNEMDQAVSKLPRDRILGRLSGPDTPSHRILINLHSQWKGPRRE